MCDYSLQHVASRAAKVQDRLITATFPNSITRGFASVGEPGVAVCLLPGTEIAFDNDVECQPAFRLFRTRKIGQRLARFRQVDANQPSVHHDALEFPGWAGRAGDAAASGPDRNGAAIAGDGAAGAQAGGRQARRNRGRAGVVVLTKIKEPSHAMAL